MKYNPQEIEKKWPRKNFSPKNLTGQAENYNPQEIEKKWQGLWQKNRIYNASDQVAEKKNFYNLLMFPYPSGDLHIGHWYNYVGGDVFARFKRLKGFNVTLPIGFDAFGLPAENAAIKRSIHPKTWTQDNIKRMREQLKSMGASFDWSREIITCEPEYYKWTQWMFLQFYKNGLSYRAKVPANFCPSCKTVLANEQVINGKCERCDSEVLQKKIEQWLFKISDFSEELLSDLKDIDWPETTKTAQKNWIGKSEGAIIKFSICSSEAKKSSAEPNIFLPHSRSENFPPAFAEREFSIEVFTTRPDTIFGCTYLVLAPEHPIINELKSEIKNYKLVEEYVEKAKNKSELERISEIKNKTGVELKGIKVINPANKREIPIFAADYVLADYGSGAIMAVPCHDQRDFEFAKTHNLAMIEVIRPESAPKNISRKSSLVISGGNFECAFEGEGYLINSGRFDGMKSQGARKRIIGWLKKNNLAENKIYYKLHDWLISRQRYWGVPIPMIFCQECGWQPVSESDLPVLLPDIKDFQPSPEGKSPLAKSRKFIEANCSKCQKPGQRETDTMDTFVCSSWYFLRYADPKNSEFFSAKEKIKKWLPVDIYIGGAEHSVMHLLYARFFVKALFKMGYLDFKEPFLKLRHNGIILGPDGQKMSKSRGNVVNPDDYVKKYGADAVRMYLCFMGPYDQGGAWQSGGIKGICRFLEKVWNLKINKKLGVKNEKLEKLLQKTIKKITQDIEELKFNTAISSLMVFINEASRPKEIGEDLFKKFLILLSPFAPHISEELWQKINNKKENGSIHNQNWPKYNPNLIEENIVSIVIQVSGRVRDKIEIPADTPKEKIKEFALSRQKVQKWVENKKIKRIIFVPGKLINIVV